MNNRERYRLNINGCRDRTLRSARRQMLFEKIRTEELKSIPAKELLKEVDYYES